jgi:hypothetical protein
MLRNGITEAAKKLFDKTQSYLDQGFNKLPNKCLQQIINNTEIEYGLEAGSIKPATIRSRLFCENIDGVHKRQQPILKNFEPLIVQWCKMAPIGMLLSRENVIELVNNMIEDTEFEKQGV